MLRWSDAFLYARPRESVTGLEFIAIRIAYSLTCAVVVSRIVHFVGRPCSRACKERNPPKGPFVVELVEREHPELDGGPRIQRVSQNLMCVIALRRAT